MITLTPHSEINGTMVRRLMPNVKETWHRNTSTAPEELRRIAFSFRSRVGFIEAFGEFVDSFDYPDRP